MIHFFIGTIDAPPQDSSRPTAQIIFNHLDLEIYQLRARFRRF